MRAFRIEFKLNGKMIRETVKGSDMIRVSAAVMRKGGTVNVIKCLGRI